MNVRYLYACALVSALASTARADLIGNPLLPRAEASDTGPYVYNVFYNSPMPSHGTIDSVSIYQMDTSTLPTICDSFTLRLLHYTGVGNLYEQYYSSQIFGIYGGYDRVQTYMLGENVQVEAGDLFVTYGQGIPFTIDESFPDTFYFTGQDFAPTTTGTIELGTQTYMGNRIYSAAVNFTATPGPALHNPEPASLSLLLAGSLALLRRRPPRQGTSPK